MKQKETFEKFKDCTSELSCITECEAFSSGFILATRIMAEVMQGLEEAENMLQTTVISNYIKQLIKIKNPNVSPLMIMFGFFDLWWS